MLAEESRPSKKMLDLRLPTQEEIEYHNPTHLPHRDWCPVYVKAKGRDLDPRAAVDMERGISEYCFDYCFLGDELGFKWTVLGGRERISGLNFAAAVTTKGASGKFAVDKALEFIEENGDRNDWIVLKMIRNLRCNILSKI